VQRYPIAKRNFDGLLVLSPKEKFALRFGDWIVESKGGVFIVPADRFAERFEEAADYDKRKAATTVAVVALVALGVLFGHQDAGLLFFGFGVTHLMYYRALLGQWNGLANSVFDLDTDTMKLAAATNTYTINQDTNEFFSDVTNEVTGTNYTAGGATLGTVTVTRSSGTVTFDAADVVWTQSGAGFSTARKFPIYRSTGAGATSKLYSVITADNDVGNVTGDLTIQFSASGIATWTTT